MRNLATAAAGLDPHVVMQMMQTEDDPADGVQMVRGLNGAFDDTKVAQLLATALAADGQASGSAGRRASTPSRPTPIASGACSP